MDHSLELFGVKNTYIRQLGFDRGTFDIGVGRFWFRWCQIFFISYPKIITIVTQLTLFVQSYGPYCIASRK